MKDRKFIVSNLINDYAKELTRLFEERCPSPVKNGKESYSTFKKKLECWCKEAGNIIGPSVIPSIWDKEFVPTLENAAENAGCEIVDSSIDSECCRCGKCKARILLPCLLEVELVADGEGTCTIEDGCGNILWDGDNSCCSMCDGLSCANATAEVILGDEWV